jgi:ubiquinone/menaquinone biosynthesis C-methylase UbiE
MRPGGLELTDRALALCSLPPGARVLDVGCGLAGSVERLIARYGLAAVGFDPSAALLCSPGRGHLPLAQAVGTHLPLAAGQVDLVLAECSLSLMGDVDCALREFRRVLRAEGWLALNDVYARRAPPGPCSGGAMTQDFLLERLDTNGFALVLWEDHAEALKRFVAQHLWSGGSLEELWGCARPPARQAGAGRGAGYYLLIARKAVR